MLGEKCLTYWKDLGLDSSISRFFKLRVIRNHSLNSRVRTLIINSFLEDWKIIFPFHGYDVMPFVS